MVATTDIAPGDLIFREQVKTTTTLNPEEIEPLFFSGSCISCSNYEICCPSQPAYMPSCYVASDLALMIKQLQQNCANFNFSFWTMLIITKWSIQAVSIGPFHDTPPICLTCLRLYIRIYSEYIRGINHVRPEYIS